MSIEDRLIERHFGALGAQRDDVRLGVGDDAALVAPPAGLELALSTDSLVLGTHFTADSAPRSLGHRALAVNLSDLAAMGAEPAWALLSLTLPSVDESWLAEFAAGFGRLAGEHRVALVGGNVARGALAITVQVAGLVAPGAALRRDGARAGDLLLVSGTLGDPAAALDCHAGRLRCAEPHCQALCRRADYPAPRVALGRALGGIASACMDVSDGLATDLPRLLAASGVGAEVDLDLLPCSAALRAAAGDDAWRLAWQGGEDYELMFSVAPAREPALRQALAGLEVGCTRVGRCLSSGGLQTRLHGNVTQVSAAGFSHFG